MTSASATTSPTQHERPAPAHAPRAARTLLTSEYHQDERWRQNLRRRLRQFGGLTFYGAEVESILALTHLRTLRQAETLFLDDPDRYVTLTPHFRVAATELARINALAERVHADGPPMKKPRGRRKTKKDEEREGRLNGLIPGSEAGQRPRRQPR